MATVIPSLSTIRGMTPGERRLGQRLESLLEDDYTVWYDIPLGRQRRYPDYIILHPGRGLLFLEVKDWKLDTLKRLNPRDAEIYTQQGLKILSNLLEQARLKTTAGKKRYGVDDERMPVLTRQSSKGLQFDTVVKRPSDVDDDLEDEIRPLYLAIKRACNKFSQWSLGLTEY